MILGIDDTNLRDGDGLTHLVELLRVAEPLRHVFSQVVVWSAQPLGVCASRLIETRISGGFRAFAQTSGWTEPRGENDEPPVLLYGN